MTPVSGFVVALVAFWPRTQASCDSTHLPRRFTEVARSASERVTKGELPSVALAIIQHGTVVCEAAFGWADREKRTPATSHTVYAAGSVAKAVTGAAIFLLASRGAIRLDDAPRNYGVTVRSRAGAGAGITIRRLLSMTAGVQHGWFYNYDSGEDGNELIQRYAVSAFRPGKHFIYSNFSFGILGEVIEGAAKRPFREFVRTELLEPLHMTGSGFNLANGNVATGYREGRAVPQHTFEPEAAGGFYTSAHELALFGAFETDPAQRLIAPRLMKEMHTPRTNRQVTTPYISGWGVFTFKDGSAVLISNGVVLAGSATLLLLPKVGVVIACLTNTGSEAMDDLAFQLADVFSPGLLAKLDSTRKEFEEREASRPFQADPSQRGWWVGTAELPTGQIPVRMQITADNQARIGFDGPALPLDGLGIEQGFLSGEVATRLTLPESGNTPSKVTLQLEWINPNQLIGTARVESTPALPQFGLPVYISLAKAE